MKLLQSRFRDNEYQLLQDLAREEEVTLSEIVRKSIILYGTLLTYERDHNKFGAVVNPNGTLHSVFSLHATQ